MHAGGVLIAPGKLTDFCPLYIADGEDATPVSQFDKDDVEAVGLVKFDFWACATSPSSSSRSGVRGTTQRRAAGSHEPGLRRPRGLPDSQGRQYHGDLPGRIRGHEEAAQEARPDRFEDIIAVLALYRPGPLGSGMVDDFILRKKGQQEIDYFHPDLKACLEPTYGVIVYQEQVMQISQIIGGYTLGGADMLRRAMGKKKAEEMAKHRETIAAGARQKGYDPALAEQLFDLATKFAEYGFNKSHTAAYAVVTYHTAWLKAYHCAAFMAATMSSDMDNTDTVKIFYEDTVANGVTVLPPDVNASHYRFVPTDAKTVRYGLGAVKGCGEPAVLAIIAAREKDGPFKDFFDFANRVDRRSVEPPGVRGADPRRRLRFARQGPRQADGFGRVAMEAAEQKAANAMQGGLFDMLPGAGGPMARIRPVRPWTERELLRKKDRDRLLSLQATPTASARRCAASSRARSPSSSPRGSCPCWPAW